MATPSPDNPVPTDTGKTYAPAPSAWAPRVKDTGQNHNPGRYEFEKKKKSDKVTKAAQRVEDRQSTEYWKEKERERKKALSEERAAAEKREKDAKPKRTKRLRGTVEVPKAGFSRIGSAGERLSGITGSTGSGGGGGGGGDYSDPFGSMSQRFSRVGGGSGLHFSVEGFGSSGVRSGGSGIGLGMYQDPFSSITTGKRGRKPRESYQSPFGEMILTMRRGRGRPPRSVFGKSLSWEMF